MSREIIIPADAPPHICAQLLDVITLESESDERFLDELERRVLTGEMTPGDAERTMDQFPDSSRRELLDFCRDNCNAGKCAMDRFGTELVAADPDILSDEEKAKLTFYTTVDATRLVGEISLGTVLF